MMSIHGMGWGKVNIEYVSCSSGEVVSILDLAIGGKGRHDMMPREGRLID